MSPQLSVGMILCGTAATFGCAGNGTNAYLGDWQQIDGVTTMRIDANGTGEKSAVCQDGTTRVTTLNWRRKGGKLLISEYIGDGLETVFLQYRASMFRGDDQTLNVDIYDAPFKKLRASEL